MKERKKNKKQNRHNHTHTHTHTQTHVSHNDNAKYNYEDKSKILIIQRVKILPNLPKNTLPLYENPIFSSSFTIYIHMDYHLSFYCFTVNVQSGRKESVFCHHLNFPFFPVLFVSHSIFISIFLFLLQWFLKIFKYTIHTEKTAQTHRKQYKTNTTFI